MMPFKYEYGDNIQDYKILESLGSGTYGETYLVEKGGEKYALKYYKGIKAVEDFDDEKTSLKAITTICKEYSACYVEDFVENSKYFIVMDYLPGISLKDAIFSMSLKIPYEQRKEIDITKDLILGLNAIHSLGLIHQDIKLDNLLYNPATKRLKYIDFGLSCILATTHEFNYQPVFGAILDFPCGSPGTILTSPPEMITFAPSTLPNTPLQMVMEKGFPKPDNGIYPTKYLIAHDIWSVGCMMLDWYTNPLSMNDTLYCKSILPTTLLELGRLDGNDYFVIYGLLNRNVDLRIENFQRAIPEYSSVFPGSISLHPPNLLDTSVTLEERARLINWRCKIKPTFTAEFPHLTAPQYNQILGTVGQCEGQGSGRKILVTIVDPYSGDIEDVTINTGDTIEKLKSLVTTLNVDNLYYDDKLLHNKRFIEEYGVSNGAILSTRFGD